MSYVTPTEEMRERWPEISDKTAIEMVRARLIDVPSLVYRPPLETWTDKATFVLVPYFGLERLELISVGDHMCLYRQEHDTLFIQGTEADNPGKSE